MKTTIERRLLLLLISGLVITASVWAQQSPSAPSSPPQETVEQKAAREKRLAERHAERRANEVKRVTERRANEAKRAAERKVRIEKEKSERHANVAKRATERKEAAARRAAETEKRRALNDGTFRFLSSRMNSDFARVVKGAPYSAVALTEFVQKFADGNQIVRRNEAAYYRDSEGRTRVEQRLSTIGKWSAAGDAPRIIMIGDPVSGEYYDLDPRTRTAVKNVRLGKVMRNQQREAGETRKGNDDEKVAPPKVSSDGRRRTESLGSQRIEGVEAQGKRTTITIPAGEIGNIRPIETTDERWYSPELQTVVMTKRHDPRSGDTTYRLTNINRRDPDRSLFQVPPGYTIIDRSAPKTVPEKTKSEIDKRSKSQPFE
jgi:hypothetical protein